MRVVVVTPPDPILTWDEVRAYTRQEADDERQSHVMGLMAAATAHIDGPDGWLGRCLGVQTLEVSLDVFEAGCPFQLTCPPVIEIVSIDWTAADGSPRSCTGDDVELFHSNATVTVFGSPPWTGMKVDGAPLRIRYRAGYQVVPDPLKVAVGMMVQRMEDGLDLEATASGAVASLLRPYRVFA